MARNHSSDPELVDFPVSARANDGTVLRRRSALEMKASGFTAEQCRDSGLTVPELIQHCYCPWAKGEDKGCYAEFEGRAVIAEGKFGIIVAVRPEATEDIKVEYDDGSRNRSNTTEGYLATDWVERGMVRLLEWTDNHEASAKADPKKRIHLKDHATLQAIISSAVAGRKGWQDVLPEDIILKECSGHGGSATFYCTYKGAAAAKNDGSALALHVLGQQFSYKSQPEFVQRTRAARHALAAADCGPELVSEFEDQWFIETWEGSAITMARLEQAAQLGRLLARIHAIPIEWYEETRSSLISSFPALAEVPSSSSLWYHTARRCWMNASRPAWAVHLVEVEELRANSVAGKRVCTVHADFHLGNIVYCSERNAYKVIDMEASCVMSAAFDFAYAFSAGVCNQSKGTKLALCRSYLEESGLPYDDDSAYALALDGERLRACSGFFTPLHQYFERCTMDDAEPGPPEALQKLERYRRTKAVADAALNDPTLAEDIIVNGLWEAQAVKAALKWPPLADNTCDRGTAVTAHTISTLGCNRFGLNWDGTIRPVDVEAWKGLVLGVEGNEVVLTNHCAGNQLVVKIDSDPPVTGYASPLTEAVELTLGGAHAGRVLVWQASGKFLGNVYGDIMLSSTGPGMRVHFEQCGAIRLAEYPHMALDCTHGKHTDGNRVGTYVFHDAACHRFSLNDDGTIGPKDAPTLILALNEKDTLVLRNKDAVSDSERLIFTGFPKGAGLQCKNTAAAGERARLCRLRLELESHPGKAVVLSESDGSVLSEDDTQTLKDLGLMLPTHKLVLGDAAEAVEVTIDSKSSRLVISNGSDAGGLMLGVGYPQAWEKTFKEAMGPVALTDGSNLSEQDEVVTCWFMADDHIDEVFYNGIDMCDYTLTGVPYVTDRPKGCDTLKTLRFKPVPGAVLAIAANDDQPGTSAAFSLRCLSTDKFSKWNFELNPASTFVRVFGTGGKTADPENTTDERVGSLGGKGAREEKWIPHPHWMANEFDDVAWSPPHEASCKHWPSKHGMHGTWYKEHKYVFFRICPM